MDILGFIPARGGSKRIPRKNIKHFLGKPIICYPISYFKKMGIKPIVSTEDKEIANIAKKYGAQVVIRSERLSSDSTGTAEVLIDYLKQNNHNPKYILVMYSTAVFAKPKIINLAFNLIKKGNGVFPMIQYSYPPQRAVSVKENFVKLIDNNSYIKNTQEFEPIYHDVGQFYLLKTKDFLKEKRLFLSKSIPLILNNLEAQDMDNEDDWKIAELKYKYLYK
jgi:pseudaminic acid cytidylyltransferase